MKKQITLSVKQMNNTKKYIDNIQFDVFEITGNDVKQNPISLNTYAGRAFGIANIISNKLHKLIDNCNITPGTIAHRILIAMHYKHNNRNILLTIDKDNIQLSNKK